MSAQPHGAVHRSGDGAARRHRIPAALRVLFRLPVWLYRLGLGPLLGHRFLLLAHRGRRSGRTRLTMLEVVRYDRATDESVVVSPLGEGADWYRNITAHPALEVRTGGSRYAPAQRFLDAEEMAAVLAGYERKHRLAARVVGRAFGLRFDGTEAGRRALASKLHGVAFRPAPERSPG